MQSQLDRVIVIDAWGFTLALVIAGCPECRPLVNCRPTLPTTGINLLLATLRLETQHYIAVFHPLSGTMCAQRNTVRELRGDEIRNRQGQTATMRDDRCSYP